MKLILSIAILAFLTVPAFSQNNSLGKNDPEAKSILDKVSAKFKTYNNGKFKADIHQLLHPLF